MSRQSTYRNLTQKQIQILASRGCSAQDWNLVKVADGFEPERVKEAVFIGPVNIGRFTKNVKSADGLEKPAGIYNATIANCVIGNNSRIANVGVHIANYEIGQGACIENVGTMATRPGAAFGNGVKVAVLNEAGGREVILFDEISVQFAYLMCMHRYRPRLIEKLFEIAKKEADKVRADRGKIGQAAQICSTSEIIDVNVGPYAVIKAAASLTNGTILSSAEAPAIAGTNVIIEDFIMAENASVTGGARLKKVYVGQGCRIGSQFSAENSLFFSNCEAFNGEACSVFAGPYTVSHHKATLLIACLFSFYNAGSGTNQSNHMYKLGPVHEGKLERGTKAGSFSYMMWPCRVGPFSVVLGKHTRIFDTSDFPFAHLEAEPNGRCLMIPGLYLATAGTLRDGTKWPSRDRRKGPVKRDFISFEVFSPYTVGKMIKACSILKNLQDTTDRSVDEVTINGAQMKRVLMRTGQKFYRTGIEMYLLEKVLERAKDALDDGIEKIREAFLPDSGAVYSSDWVDIGGLLMPRQRLLDLTEAVESGKVSDFAAFSSELKKIYNARTKDEWAWVRNAYKEVFGSDLQNLAKDDLIAAAESYRSVRMKFLKQVLADAEKDFDKQTRTGFGQDGCGVDIDEDFRQVRGQYDDNRFVKETRDNIEAVERYTSRLKAKIAAIS
jgi:hypothetical protein